MTDADNAVELQRQMTDGLGINNFVVNLKNLGISILRKKLIGPIFFHIEKKKFIAASPRRTFDVTLCCTLSLLAP